MTDTYTLTVYIAPAGTPEINPITFEPMGDASVGHMFYSITDDNGTPPPTVSYYGFAPQSSDGSVPFANGQANTTDDIQYQLSAPNQNGVQSYQKTITQAQYDTLQAFGDDAVAENTDGDNSSSDTISGENGVDFSMYYNGLTNSCVDFTWAALETIGTQEPNYVPGTQLLPTWNETAVQQALASGSTSNPASLDYYDDDDNLIESKQYNSGGTLLTDTTYTYTDGVGSYTVTATTKNNAGEVIGTSTETISTDDDTSSDDAKTFDGSTGTQLNEQQIVSDNSSNATTDTVSGNSGTVDLNNTTITLDSGVGSVTIAGASNSVTAAAGDSCTVTNTGNSITSDGTSSSGITVNLDGTSNSLTLNGNYTTLNVADWNTASIAGSEDTAYGSDDTVDITGTSNTNDNLVGSSDTLRDCPIR